MAVASESVIARRFDPTAVIMYAITASIGFLALYPVAAIVLHSFVAPSASGVIATWRATFAEPGLLQSLVNTGKVVLATTAISVPVAIVISWLLARTDMPGSEWLEFGFWILFFLPALGTTTGWLLMFDPGYGLANRFLVATGLFSAPPFNMYSFGGIVFAHLSTYAIAVKVMLMTPAFRHLDGAIEEASRICGAGSLRILLRIVIPVLAPPLTVALLMSLIRSLEAFEIELFLGLPAQFSVYSTKLYLLLSGSPPNFAAASILASIVVLLMIPLLVLQRWMSTRRSFVLMTGQYRPRVLSLGRWRWPVFFLLLLTVSLMSLLPLLLQVAGSLMTLFGFFDIPKVWTFAHWWQAVSDPKFTVAIENTLVLGLGTALAAVVFFAVIAYCTVRVRHWLAGPLDVVSWLPLTLPGILLGFGILWMVLEIPLFSPFYGSMGILILVSLLCSMTLGIQVLKSNMLQIGPELEEAARIVGGSWRRSFQDVMVPLTMPAVIVVAVMVFSQTIRQVSTLVLLSTGDNEPVSLLQLEYLRAGLLGPAAVSGTVIVMLSLAAAAVVRIMTQRFGIQAR
jgi:iron(III) transport system permease protein